MDKLLNAEEQADLSYLATSHLAPDRLWRNIFRLLDERADLAAKLEGVERERDILRAQVAQLTAERRASDLKCASLRAFGLNLTMQLCPICGPMAPEMLHAPGCPLHPYAAPWPKAAALAPGPATTRVSEEGK